MKNIFTLALENEEVLVDPAQSVENKPAEEPVVIEPAPETEVVSVTPETTDAGVFLEAVETPETEPVTDLTEDVYLDESDSDLLKAETEIQNDFDESEKINLAVESLISYIGVTSELIKEKRCSLESLKLIKLGSEPHLRTLGFAPVSFALENEKTVEELHQIALEDFFTSFIQTVGLSAKHVGETIVSLFESKENSVQRFKHNIKASQSWLKSGGLDSNKTVTVRLYELWYYFKTSAGQTKDIVSALTNEVEMSNYVLHKYTDSILNEIKKLTSIVNSIKGTSDKDAAELAKKVQALKSPVDLFDKSYLNGHYLNVSNFAVQEGSDRKIITVENETFEKLAKLATPSLVTFEVSYKHIGLKSLMQVAKAASTVVMPPVLMTGGAIIGSTAGALAGATVGGITAGAGGALVGGAALGTAGAVVGKIGGAALAVPAIGGTMGKLIGTVKMDKNSLQKALTLGDELLDNASHYLSLVGKLESVNKDLVAAFNKLEKFNNGTDNVHFFSVITQVHQYSKNLTLAFERPGIAIAAHSIKGGKYCTYLASVTALVAKQGGGMY
jgi:hypothetical protein